MNVILILITILILIIGPLILFGILTIRDDISAHKRKMEEDRRKKIFDDVLDQIDIKVFRKLLNVFNTRDYLYSVEYNKYFLIQHLPTALSVLRSQKLPITKEEIVKSVWNSPKYINSLYISTDDYNQDIGLDINLGIKVTDIGKTYFFKDEWLSQQRENKLKKILDAK